MAKTSTKTVTYVGPDPGGVHLDPALDNNWVHVEHGVPVEFPAEYAEQLLAQGDDTWVEPGAARRRNTGKPKADKGTPARKRPAKKVEATPAESTTSSEPDPGKSQEN